MVGVRDAFHVLADTPCDLVPGQLITEFERAVMLLSGRRLSAVPLHRYRELLAMLPSKVVRQDLDFLTGERKLTERCACMLCFFVLTFE